MEVQKSLPFVFTAHVSTMHLCLSVCVQYIFVYICVYMCVCLCISVCISAYTVYVCYMVVSVCRVVLWVSRGPRAGADAADPGDGAGGAR